MTEMWRNYERLLRNPDALEAYLATVDSSLRSQRAFIEIVRAAGDHAGTLLVKWQEEQERSSVQGAATHESWISAATNGLSDDGPTDPLYIMRGIAHLEMLGGIQTAATEATGVISESFDEQRLDRDELLHHRGRLHALADIGEQIVRTLRAELRYK